MDSITNTLQHTIDESTLFEMASKALHSWASENSEYSDILRSTTIELRNHKFCFKSSEVNAPYFESTYALVKNGDEIGRYTLITNTSGAAIDDFYELF